MADETSTLDYSQVPSFIVGADSHNIASEGFSWFSPASWYEAASNAPKFAAASVLSGLNSFYNSGVAIGNLFGGDFKDNDTYSFISGIDSNLGQYYQENQESVDLAGFIATSFIPGTAAIKGLKAGQNALRAAEAGFVGTNMSKATGLLIPNAQTYINLASKEIASSQAAFSGINKSLIKAIGAGFGQAALESAAFETGVAATMFKSPILEDMDLKDLAINMAVGTAFGGIVGGAFSGAGAYGKVKKGVKLIEEAEKPFVSITELPEGMSASSRLIARFDDLNNIPAIPPNSPDAARLTQLAGTKKTRLNNLILEDVKSITGDDTDAATMLYNALQGSSNQQIVENLTRVQDVVRVGKNTAVEDLVNTYVRRNQGMVVYHGTGGADFATINLRKENYSFVDDNGNLTQYNMPTAYFTPDKALAKAYSEQSHHYFDPSTSRILTAELKGKALTIDAEGKSWTQAYGDAFDRAKREGQDFIVVKNVRDHPTLNNFEATTPTSTVVIALKQNAINVTHETVDQIRQRYVLAGKEIHGNYFYAKLAGEDAGKVFPEAPKYLNLADKYQDIKSFIAKQGFKAAESVPVTNLNADQAEARYLWASKLTAKDLSNVTIHDFDFPLLERAYELGIPAKVLSGEGTITLDTREALFRTLKKNKDFAAEALVGANTDLQYKKFIMGPEEELTSKELAKFRKLNTKLDQNSLDSIAAQLNMRQSYLQGSEAAVPEHDILARQSYNQAYTQDLINKGLWKQSDGLYDVGAKPQWLKFGAPRDPSVPFELEGMAYIKQKEKLLLQQVDNVASHITGGMSDRIYRPTDDLLLKANRYGAGSGALSFANGNYGSLEGWADGAGKVTADIMKKMRENLDTALNPHAYALSQNLDAALEFQAINQTIARTTEKYVLDATGDNLVARKIANYEAKVAAGERTGAYPSLQEGALERIPIKSQITKDFIGAHIDANGSRVNDFKAIRAVQGLEDSKDPSTFYPIKPNPKNYRYFAFVTDDTVTGSGHVTMMHAADEKTLEQMITKVKAETKYTVVTKSESEAYHKAIGDYDFERTLHENYIDTDLKSRGINSQFIPRTDPELISKEFMDWHHRATDVLARETISAKFDKEFSYLRRLGEQYSNISTSKYASNAAIAETVTKNPYLNYVKTALNISKFSEYPLLQSFNNLMDTSFSRAYRSVADYFQTTKTPEELDQVNAKFQQYGLKTAFFDAATDLLANKVAPQGELSKFIRRANGILSTLTLRLDPLNAINNAVGHGVLLGSETRAITRAIAAGDSDSVGKLAALTQVQLPGVKDTITSAGRLILGAQQRFFSDLWGDKKLYNFYKEQGFITRLTDQFKDMIDTMTLRGDETVKTLNSKMDQAFQMAKNFGNKGEQITGNKFAEEFNRFVAADVMKQLTDVAIEAGVMDGKEQLSYINTFVNRTQGNMLASQRPVLFQGPIGQAIGLFQTYQFNLMQQLFRHVAEGSKKDATMLLGLQGTIYGLNGLPAFDFVNKHIIGTASGNPQHRDLYDATYGVFGNNVADFLMYGLPSNALHTNLYSRGDINPRHLTVVPVNPVDIPIYGSYSRFLSNLYDTSTKIANGGAFWESILQGLEHNGLSRPLAGIAQELQAVNTGGTAFSTSSRGNILGTNDLFSLTSMARIAGGRPFDEARLLDAIYRYKYYASSDFSERQSIAEAVKSHVIGGTPLTDQDTIEGMLKRYSAAGGKQLQFNQWMMQQYKAANTSQVNKIKDALNSPYSQSLQRLMGGEEYLDGRNL